MRRIFFVVVFTIFFLSFSHSVFAEKGEIYKVTYEPSEVVALSNVVITIGVQNTDENKNDYKLKVLVTHEGDIVSEQSFSFNLEPKKGITLSPVFTPRTIGLHNVIVKLYDKNEINLLDSKIIEFNSISYVGPFDLRVELPTKIVRPNTRTPIILTLENKGYKSTDVEMQIKIRCPSYDVKESFFVLAESNSVIEKTIGLDSCPTTGVYDVVADVILFNKTWISSTSQIVVNESITELLFDPPTDLNVDVAKSLVFDVIAKNIGSKEIDTLKLIITRIPPEWVQITPQEVKQLQPNTPVVFVVNITVPADVKTRQINFTFFVTGKDMQSERKAVLNVLGMATTPTTEEKEKPATVFTLPIISLPNISQVIAANSVYLYASGGVAFAVLLLRMFIARGGSWQRERRGLMVYRMEKLRRNILKAG